MTEQKIKFEPEFRALENNEEILLNDKIKFTFVEPLFEDAMMVYSHFESLVTIQKLDTLKDIKDEAQFGIALAKFKINEDAMKYLLKCVYRCLIDNLAIKEAKEINKNKQYLNAINNQVLFSIIATYGGFTEAQSGE